MAEIKISDLTAKGANIANTDRFVIAESDGAGGFTSKYILGSEITAVSAESIYLTDGTIRGDRTLDLSGAFVLFTNGANNILKLNPSTNDITFNNEYTFPTADGTSGQTAMEHMRAIDERTLALFIRPRAIRSGLQKALERWTAH